MQEPIYSLSGILAKEDYIALATPEEVAVLVLSASRTLSLHRLDAHGPHQRGRWSLLLYAGPTVINISRFRMYLLTNPALIGALNALCRSRGPSRAECAQRLTRLFSTQHLDCYKHYHVANDQDCAKDAKRATHHTHLGDTHMSSNHTHNWLALDGYNPCAPSRKFFCKGCWTFITVHPRPYRPPQERLGLTSAAPKPAERRAYQQRPVVVRLAPVVPSTPPATRRSRPPGIAGRHLVALEANARFEREREDRQRMEQMRAKQAKFRAMAEKWGFIVEEADVQDYMMNTELRDGAATAAAHDDEAA